MMSVCIAAGVQASVAQNVPQLGKDPVEQVVSAMTTEEKVSLLVGTGMAGVGGQSEIGRAHV